MSTRLERLLALLDTGTTPATRKAAAIQIGEIQKYHPYDLPRLLDRVLEFLKSKNWDTRIAAGQAIDAIAQNVPQWEPKPTPPREGEEPKLPPEVPRLTFDGFDINQVLTKGAPLLASGGQEYDPYPEGTNTLEKLKRQRAILLQRIGLQFGGEEMGTLISEEDVMIEEHVQTKLKEEESAKRQAQDMLKQIEATQGLSARERNKLKRKAKQLAKSTSSTTTSASLSTSATAASEEKKARALTTVVTEQPQAANKLVVEAVVDTTKALEDTDEWPFEGACAALTNGLFHANWEVRHGAAVGLREILKRHASGAGRHAAAKSEENDRRNRMWLVDCALRLLCVFALDRFGDYVSDQVVAPVRETAAQAMGALVKHMCKEDVEKVVEMLVALVASGQWEARHGGLLGMKYVLAVRVDIVDGLLPQVLPALVTGLGDRDDDVRAVSAEALLPVVAAVVRLQRSEVPRLLTMLWDTLLDLDDLTASTSSIMSLLAEFYSYSDITCSSSSGQVASLPTLVPRLWPFLRHCIASVRAAALKTLERLLGDGAAALSWLPAVLAPALRHVFQELLLEDKDDITAQAHRVWNALVGCCRVDTLHAAAVPHVAGWLSLLATPPGTAFDPALLLTSHFQRGMPTAAVPMEVDAGLDDLEERPSKGSKKRGRKTVANTDGEAPAGKRRKTATATSPPTKTAITASAPTVTPFDESAEANVRMRLAGVQALGVLIRRWPEAHLGDITRPLMAYLVSPVATQRQTAALTVVEWVQFDPTALCVQSPAAADALRPLSLRLVDILNAKDADTANGFAELDPLRVKLASDYRVLFNSLLAVGVAVGEAMPPNAPIHEDRAVQLATSTFDSAVKSDNVAVALRDKPKLLDQLEARRKRLLAAIGQLQNARTALQTTTMAAVAAAAVSLKQLPAKLNPIVRSLMDSIKREDNTLLQRRSAIALAHLIDLCRTHKPCPNAKIIKNVCTYVCTERVVSSTSGELVSTSTSQTAAAVDTAAETAAAAHVMTRGGVYALEAIAGHFGALLFDALPKLWDTATGPLLQASAAGDSAAWATETACQDLVNSLQVLKTLMPAVHSELHAKLLALLPALFALLRQPHAVVRAMAAKCVAAMCRVATLPVMHDVITRLLPGLGDASNPDHRLGCVETLHEIVEVLGLAVLPYIVLLVVPLLGRMSDQSQPVRQLATFTFGTLVKLLPLEAGVEDPNGLAHELAVRKAEERHFLEQLLDGKKLDHYGLPIRIKTELRRYQQEGVNWLAFLHKYGLHGILCDDMGLGKTLQALCIMASDYHHRRTQYAATHNVDMEPLPSLVVCPPTLVAHWYHEVLKFTEDFAPIMYTGPPAERARKRAQLRNYPVVITSYDVLRNDIEHLREYTFNYCVLDEGHVIKNAKAKTTQAVKQVRAHHRLILSGTPIQNHVLELWSLFDFLMPGFLGSERLFNEMYGKPILAARDPKCSAKEAEAGTLALEALHRQVLPFLLRRMKEDVLQDLPPKIIQDYYCDLSPLQARLYEDFSRKQVAAGGAVEGAVTAADEDADDDASAKSHKKGQATHIFQALQYLRKLCNHPLLVLNDKHPRYAETMQELRQKNETLHDLSHAPKLQALKQLLLECGIGATADVAAAAASTVDTAEPQSVVSQHRVLIFAQMKEMLDLIETDLLRAHLPNVTYLRLDGSVESSKRHAIVTRFNEDPTIDILLLTTHVGGLGLNLTGADTVIFVEHDWNPTKDLQAMDRAHRIGQKRVVNVYRLITRGTLEEKIMGLQRFKTHMANTVVTRENSSLQTMDTAQLLNLFTLSPASDGKDKPAAETETEAVATAGEIPEGKKKSTGLKALLDGLGELWDASQYEEYNLDAFMKSLSG